MKEVIFPAKETKTCRNKDTYIKVLTHQGLSCNLQYQIEN